MASIIVDGPRAWASDVISRKLGRLAGALSGGAMLAAVFIISGGPARLACAVGAVILLVRTTVNPPEPAVTIEDIAELEVIILSMRDQENGELNSRLDTLTDMVSAIRAQLR